jgi:hypothetical protein
MVYDCESWLAWPWCWFFYGQIQTVLQMGAIAVFGWSVWTLARERA